MDDAGVTRTRTTARATAEGLRVFVAGVPWHVSEDVLRRDFEECGVVEDLFLLKDKEGNSRGRCFITFREADAVQAALKYDNTDYGGRKIYVKIAEAKRGSQNEAAELVSKQPSSCTSICLKNLTDDASEGDIRKFLKGCSVEAVRIPVDRTTGAPRGIAFVDFSTSESVDKAMNLCGKEMKGSVVEVKCVTSKSVKAQKDVAVSYPDNKPEGCTSICLKNLGDSSEDDVWGFLKGCEVQSVRIVYDRMSGAPRGIAFADFASTEEVDKAMRHNGKTLKGRPVEIRYEAPKVRPRPDGCFTVAVKKLAPTTLETDVRKLFKGLDSISDVRIICDKMGACTGLAFAEFLKETDVEAAVKRDGMSVLGNTVFICYETKQKKVKDWEVLPSNEAEDSCNQKTRKKDKKGVSDACNGGSARSDCSPTTPAATGRSKKKKNNTQTEHAGDDALDAHDTLVTAPSADLPSKKNKKIAQQVETSGNSSGHDTPVASVTAELPSKKKKKAEHDTLVASVTPELPPKKRRKKLTQQSEAETSEGLAVACPGLDLADPIVTQPKTKKAKRKKNLED